MPQTNATITLTTQRRIQTMQARLRTARIAAGISQEALGAKLGVTGRSLRDWERAYDCPSTRNAMAWAACLGYRFTLKDHRAEIEYAPEPLWELDWQTQEYKRWATLLKARRKQLGLSQTDAGLIVGVTRSTLQRWEDGEQIPLLTLMVTWPDKLHFSFELTKTK